MKHCKANDALRRCAFVTGPEPSTGIPCSERQSDKRLVVLSRSPRLVEDVLFSPFNCMYCMVRVAIASADKKRSSFQTQLPFILTIHVDKQRLKTTFIFSRRAFCQKDTHVYMTILKAEAKNNVHECLRQLKGTNSNDVDDCNSVSQSK